MNMSHETVTELKGSLGENELTFPKVLKPDQKITILLHILFGRNKVLLKYLMELKQKRMVIMGIF